MQVYTAVRSSSVLELEAQVTPQLLALRHFSEKTAMRTFVGEWALSNLDDSLSLENVSHWWYGKIATLELSMGLAIWNYDGPGGWGGVVPNGQQPRSFWARVNRFATVEG